MLHNGSHSERTDILRDTIFEEFGALEAADVHGHGKE